MKLLKNIAKAIIGKRIKETEYNYCDDSLTITFTDKSILFIYATQDYEGPDRIKYELVKHKTNKINRGEKESLK